MTITVRDARKEDMQHVVDMIQELADFEKMPNEPQLKVEDLVRDGGFDETPNSATPSFFCFIVESTESNDEHSSNIPIVLPVGYALCFNIYSTWKGKSLFLEDIYIKPSHRDNGAGRLLFNKVIKHAHDTNCNHLDFHVLDWNPAKTFYEKLNAINLTSKEQWQLYRVNREQIQQFTVDNLN